MSSFNLVRWGALSALLAGAAWVASVVIDLAFTGRLLLQLVYALAWVGTLGGLVGLHVRQAGSYGWLGTSGFFAAFVGAVLALGGTLLTLLTAAGFWEDPVGQALGLGLFLTLIGIVTFGGGFVLLGVASVLWPERLPVWCGAAIIIALPAAWVLGFAGGIVLGIVWLALAYALWQGNTVSTERFARVR